jgi:hypothetical protein
LREEALGEGGTAKLLCNFLDLPGGDPFDVHLHQGQTKRPLVSLVAGEEPRGEGALPILGTSRLRVLTLVLKALGL